MWGRRYTGAVVWLLLMPANGGAAPLTLEFTDYLDRALQHSPAAQEIDEDLALADWDSKVAQAQFKTRLVPLANVGASQGTGSQRLGLQVRKQTALGTELSSGVELKRRTSNDFVLQNTHTGRVYVQLSQSLLRRFGKRYNRAAVTVAEWRRRQAEWQALGQRQTLLATVSSEYYQTVLAKRQQRQAQRALTAARTHAAAVRSRLDRGRAAPLAEQQAELAVLQARDTLVKREQTLRQQRTELAARLALSLERQVEVSGSPGLLTPIIPEDWEDALLAYRHDWQQHRIDQQIQRLRLYRARRNLLPDISVNVRVSREGRGDSFAAARRLDETDWSVQLQLESNLEQTQERANRARQSLAQTQLARAGAALRRRINQEVEQAFEALETAARRRQIATLQWQQANQALQLAQQKFERGLIDRPTLQAAADEVFAQATHALQVLLDYNRTAIELGKALGVLDRAWLRAALNEPDKGLTEAERAALP